VDSATRSDAPGEQSVNFLTEPGTATPGGLHAQTGTLIFGEFEQTKVIRVPVLNDAVKEDAESFNVILSNPSAGTSLGSSRRSDHSSQ
jgi:hypothetical protein